MIRPSSNLRLFVAIYPPQEIARRMLDELARLDLPPHRATPHEQVHMTVQFIGDAPATDLDQTLESVDRAAAGVAAFTLSPHRLIQLPERGAARLVAAETDLPAALAELHRRLVTRLARNARDRDDERFRPHFTLCRFRSPVRGVKIERPLPTDQFAEFKVSALKVMRSTLTPTGAAHHEVASFTLD